jgi:hypothetical protein
VNTRAERLAYVAAELRNVRENLIVLTGSPRASEVKMVLDLECAVTELARLADRPRSRPYISGNPPATVRSAALKVNEDGRS